MRVVVATVALLVGVGAHLLAQGPATASISGTVTASDGSDLEGTEVLVVNQATGFTTRGAVRRGRFSVGTLDVGGPYSVRVRRIGFREVVADSLFLSLGDEVRLALRLERAPTVLPALVVSAPVQTVSSAGLVSIISDTLLRRLPTVNRDLYSFVQLSPHVSTARGVSGAGVNFRFTGFRVDGVAEQAVFGRNPSPTGKQIPIEAVKEYQVMVAPYEVWHGGFAGALVNAVTRSGGNDLQGSLYAYARNELLARNVPSLRDAPYDRLQYGVALGGPLVGNRAHFFVATELQHHRSPAAGPYLGQESDGAPAVPVGQAEIERFVQVLGGFGLEAGSAGQVSIANPLLNLFARLDVALPAWNGRLVLRHNFGNSRSERFSRPGGGDPFPLSTVGSAQQSSWHATVAQLQTSFRSGARNELAVGRSSGPVSTEPFVPQPLVTVLVPRAGDPGTARLQAGSPASLADAVTQRAVQVVDLFTLPVGQSHRITLGVEAEVYTAGRSALLGRHGQWTFWSLDSLEQGQAASYRISSDFGGGNATVSGTRLTFLAGDAWQLDDRLSVSAGIRAELPLVNGHPPYAPVVETLFGRRTDRLPATRVIWSPRIGFTWDLDRGGRDRLRGGLGVFTSPWPLNWWVNVFANYGEGIRTLQCGTTRNDRGPAPPFEPDYRKAPTACANGQSVQTDRGGPVNLLDPDLSPPRVLNASLAYERRFAWGLVASVEGLLSRRLRDVVFLNRALAPPSSTDRDGRTLYGALDILGKATAGLVSTRFPEVVDLVSHSRNRYMELSVQLAKRFSEGIEAVASYTYSRTRDVQTPLSPVAVDNWRAWVLSGVQDALPLTRSDLDQPHRIVVAGTYGAPWRRWRTEVSLLYVAGTGLPFTYLAGADAAGSGDLNADGALNDPIYVPRVAADPSEIRFGGTGSEVALQQEAFEQFVARTSCLAGQRGRILERNSCRGPWVHTLHLSLRQGLPSPWGHSLALTVELFNALNLLDRDWGLVRTPNVTILRHVGQTTGPPSTSQGLFRFDPAFVPTALVSPASYYQIQFALRYGF
jgi:hypothetical protein